MCNLTVFLLNKHSFINKYMYMYTMYRYMYIEKMNRYDCFFMARRAIPMIAFPRVRCMFIYIYIYIYIYICLCHLREYGLYTQLRKLHHSRGLGQLMGVARKRMRDQALHTSRKKAVELT